MRVLKNLRTRLLVLAVIVASATVWIVWNRPAKVDMATYVPGDSLAFISGDDLPGLAGGIEGTEAWREFRCDREHDRNLRSVDASEARGNASLLR